VAGQPQYVDRAIDEHGHIVDVYVSPHRAAADAEAFFRRALAETEGRPRRVTTDKAGCYPPALAAVPPEVEHGTGKLVQQRLERDHQHLKGWLDRLRPMRGFKCRRTAQVVCTGHAFVRNLAAGVYDLGAAAAHPDGLPLAMRAWDELTDALLAG
jgi:transposase, IS6 family